MKVFGQEVGVGLFCFSASLHFDVDDETLEVPMIGLEHLDAHVALQVIDYRYLDEFKYRKLSHVIKKRMYQFTQRAIGEGEMLDSIVIDLCTVLYGHCADMMYMVAFMPIILKALAEHMSPDDFSKKIRKVEYSELIAYCVKCYYRLSQPMVKSARKV